ncbi:Hypothetical protein GbCGDNIH1_1372 [Granulibacter bethesdensis CGDNIH1]|nr:Hypothetical protein GbCGDNIH1_1372 [Granulibacter bethesdensis CGDNIH1]APH52096.1 Hypothetical protein GbCGDNIH5_1372 [Granulibacter bethesdensis]APH64787.1 Hypothetical protein GbCGDNIH1I4_1372 [Granulibacter bethesdensis]
MAQERNAGGSSPRRRGTLFLRKSRHGFSRFIPAQAGNTPAATRKNSNFSVHPRAGGEHLEPMNVDRISTGSSPRRRGTPRRPSAIQEQHRFIPAQAGNTVASNPDQQEREVHPRAGGEHPELLPAPIVAAGSSPRRRGTHREAARMCLAGRFIPAQAGNTVFLPAYGLFPPVHPRAGGEHNAQLLDLARGGGSSPRRRGTHRNRSHDLPRHRFIPAQAGNTFRIRFRVAAQTVHPRAGGEHSKPRTAVHRAIGSSPRRRGTPGPRCDI